MFSKTILVGNIGRISDLHDVNGGAKVLNLRLATVRRYNDPDGNLQEQTEWHDIVAWGPRAENMEKVLEVGDQLLVEGRNETSKSEKDGKTYVNTRIRVEHWQLLGRPKKSNGQTAAEASPAEETEAVAESGNGTVTG